MLTKAISLGVAQAPLEGVQPLVRMTSFVAPPALVHVLSAAGSTLLGEAVASDAGLVDVTYRCALAIALAPVVHPWCGMDTPGTETWQSPIVLEPCLPQYHPCFVKTSA